MSFDSLLGHRDSTEASQFLTTKLKSAGVPLLQRSLIYGYFAQLNMSEHATPNRIVLDIVGMPGYGKTAQFNSAIDIINTIPEISKHVTVERKWKMDPGGITELADLFGMEVENHETKRMETYNPSWWPNSEAETFWLLLDDHNRAQQHIAQGLKELFNTGGLNGRYLTKRAYVVATSNPDDGSHNVSNQDGSQQTRRLTIYYSPDKEDFLTQMEVQGFHGDIKNIMHKSYTDFFKGTKEVSAEIRKGLMPDVNWRNMTMFAHLYPWLRYDESALILIADSNVGSHFVTALKTMQDTVQPIEPEDIFNKFTTIEGKINLMINPKAPRMDAIQVTNERIKYFLRNATKSLTKPQVQNLAKYLEVIPESSAVALMSRLAIGAKSGSPALNILKEFIDIKPLVGRINKALSQGDKDILV